MNDQKLAPISLTPTQKKAVQHLSTDLIVSAGAGTGKTRVLVERILHILKNGKAGIGELLILTFTDKAANEIKTRLSAGLRNLGLEQIRRELEQAAIGTFHAFAARLLKEHPLEARVDPDFRVLESEQADLLQDEAATRVLETTFRDNDPSFDAVRVYGENAIRSGFYQVFAAARHEGRTLTEFFSESREKKEAVLKEAGSRLLREAEAQAAKLGDDFDKASWVRFKDQPFWDWQTLGDFREWRKQYSCKHKDGWKEWRNLADALAAVKIEPLAEPWAEKFEALALKFERTYEAAKKEENRLDFDDLQSRAVALFADSRPACQKMRERYRRRFKFILVDEFQDTNYLQMRFIGLLSSGSNVFTVGDYKQSIYGFRGAEPRIFLELDEKFRSGKAGVRIPLVENFRSGARLLEKINAIFRELWREDRDFPFEELEARAEEGPGPVPAEPVEMLVTNLGEDEGGKEHAKIREAIAVAARIRSLREREGVPYGNIAVLFRGMKQSGIYEHAMKVFDIPYFIMSGRGFYHQPEIRDIVSYLTHLEKPLLDIPLAAALRSPLFHITDSTLFWLSKRAKSESKTAPLRRALKEACNIHSITEDQQSRLNSFISLTDELRSLKDRMPLSQLIDRILEATGYELTVLADRGGNRRYANLKKLIAMVREQEALERMPLARFLVMLERLETQEVRESEAQVAAEEGGETVRMMTIHAAKGLEFPVVIVAGMGSEGKNPDPKSIIAHANEGFAIRLRNDLTRAPEKSRFYQILDEKMILREKEERKRLFYVACTRAKSRLILSGIREIRKKPKDRYADMLTWMDWMDAIAGKTGIPAACDTDRAVPFFGQKPENLREKIRKALETMRPAQEAGPVPEPAREAPRLRSIDLPVSAYVLFSKDPQAFWRTYQIGWQETREDVRDAEEAEEEERPGYRASDFGTAMHSLLERIDLTDPDRYLEQDVLDREFGSFGKDGIRDGREILKAFFGSALFKRLRKADRVEREVDFTLNGRRGLIHGKIDALFRESDGAWHVLDYKTAAGDRASAEASGHDLQIGIYALAVSRILKEPVRSGMIYYLKNAAEVTTDFPQAPDVLDGIEKRICDLQQKILDFCNRKMVH